MTTEGWIRSIDAIDLMQKSGWQLDDAKRTLASYIAREAVDWKAEWARFYNAQTERIEEVTSTYSKEYGESPASIVFRAVANNYENENDENHVLVKIGVPNRNPSPDENIEDGPWYKFKAHLADWQSGDFRVSGVERGDVFFGVHGLSVAKKDIMRLLSAEVILDYGHIIDFDFSKLGKSWADTSKKIDSESENGRSLPVKKPYVSASALEKWWIRLADIREPMSITALWRKAKEDFPENEIGRRSIESLAAGRKRGRKPKPHN